MRWVESGSFDESRQAAPGELQERKGVTGLQPCLDVGASTEPQRIWDDVCQALRRDYGARTFESWLKPIRFGGFDRASGAVRLDLPTRFMADWIANHFGDRIRLALAARLAGVTRLELSVTPAGERPLEVAPTLVPDPAGEAPRTEAAAAIGATLEARYSFDSFVVGKSNELAYNAARTLAEGGSLGFNPLFLHGTTGLGKTHLMHAIGHEVRRQDPRAKVAYLSAEKFMVEFLAALRAKDTISFKQKLRSVDVLMIDDVQFISGKESTQEEFFHTMNELISAGRRLVITADRSPQNLEGIQDRILSRLAWGLVADINTADYELRLNILHMKLANVPHAHVPVEVIEFLARRITSNVRELEGALNRVVAYATLGGKTIDLDFTRDVLAETLRAHDRKVTIDDIQRRVAEHYRIKPSDMVSARRAREVARPRQVAMYLAKRLTPRSLPEIGRRFGGRDHTTVMHAVKRIEALRSEDAELNEDLLLLSRQLEG
jgi:chromosomal replication initiator protein